MVVEKPNRVRLVQLSRSNGKKYWHRSTYVSNTTPWSRVLLEKLTVAQRLNQFPTFYGTKVSITLFIWTSHRTLSWAKWIQSTPWHTIFIRTILILYFHRCQGFLCDIPFSFFLDQSVQRWDTGWRTGVRFLAGPRDFSVLHSVQGRQWGPPSLLSNGYLGLFPLG
jgi:hypothetical protein